VVLDVSMVVDTVDADIEFEVGPLYYYSLAMALA
jgi:hypothetical protein